MATQESVVKVWIEPGCIVCDACETTCPDVFQVTDDTCIVRPEALNAEFTKPLTQSIVEAAEECPVDVIKYELAAVAVGAAAAPPAKAAAAKAPAKPGTPTPAAPSKAPTAPPAKAPAEPAPAVAAKAPTKQPVTSVAGSPDPAIQALLRAATYRGGKVGIDKKEAAFAPSAPAVEEWRKKSPDELPPDARQARLLEAAKPSPADEEPSRRDVLAGAAMGIGWLAFAVTGGLTAGPVFGRFMMPNVLEEPDPRVRVGKLEKYVEMAPGDVNEDYKPQGIWMIREEERIAALSIICTHLGCIPNWLPNDRKFKCPCHGSGYKPNGINFEGPTPRPLERFKVSVVDGIVLVDKSKKFQYEKGEWVNPDSFIAV